ncbi:MAG: aldehyde dehydrogenase family protein, partial [Flavobacteriales bacterium]
EDVKMGPLASHDQVEEVQEKVKELLNSCEVAYGSNMDDFQVVDADRKKGAFMPSTLLYCDKPLSAAEPHSVEAFGPVNTIMGYKDTDEAIELAKRGKRSLVGSFFTADNSFARDMVMGTASQHGRLMLINKDSAKESTGHGSPLPHLVHGGPGRAGGGEEMGGIRGVYHFMQRTALQGSPTTLSDVTQRYMPGAKQKEKKIHPFQQLFDDLEIGETYTSHKRTVTE